MNSNVFLEDLLYMLAAYGRPKVNQISVSATPGARAAGVWNVEVSIKPRALKDMDEATIAAAFQGHHHVSARCIGKAATPKEAAQICLQKCECLMEGELAKFYAPESAEDVKRAEDLRFSSAITMPDTVED